MTRLTGLAFQLAVSLSQILTKGALREIELEEEEEDRVKKSATAATKSRRGPLIIELDSESEGTFTHMDKVKQDDQLSLRWSFAKSTGSIRGVIEDLKTVCCLKGPLRFQNDPLLTSLLDTLFSFSGIETKVC